MSLERYRLDRVVVQNPQTSVYDAARAMESNHIGLIVVAEHGRIVGVLTDRDIALRVTSFQLDPLQATLADVMTEDPATLPIAADEQAALGLMRDRHIRRIPLVEDGTAVGMVTLDDLILSQTADRAALRDVVRAQLAEPAQFKPKDELHPIHPARYPSAKAEDRLRARHVRARQKTVEVVRFVQMTTQLATEERALQAFDTVVSSLVCRVTPGEAKDMLSQLPSELRERWLDLPAGPNLHVTRATLVDALAQRLMVDSTRADAIARAVGLALTALLTDGELDDLRGQLPEGLRELL
ncbi:MAG: hypothetical protein RL685_206 [Pseudomonadota bacterium]|jgi:CBS domain-containing protein/uncharacterized protein (DUF2267 family)